MKKIVIFLMVVLCTVHFVFAQQTIGVNRTDLPNIFITSSSSLHISSPEPIQYVDISSQSIVGDLPLDNLLRLKIIPDSLTQLKQTNDYLGIVTVVGESFIAQYNLYYSAQEQLPFLSKVNILPEQMQPLDFPGMTLTSKEMYASAMRILNGPTRRPKRKVKDFGIQVQLNNVFTAGDYVFLDLTYYNYTNLSYQIDEQRFKIEDKKITKATNVQSIEIKPVWKLYATTSFKKQYRNIYVLKKVTFPGNKVLNIELTEKQLSGRMLTLQLKYSDILKADAF